MSRSYTLMKGETIVSTTEVSKPPPRGPPCPTAADLGPLVRGKARALGFDAVAFARADLPLDEEMRRYESFLDAGMHGEMRYLGEHAEARRSLSTSDILEGARSVVCLARRYPRELEHRADEPSDEGLVPNIARYARGQDYHNFLRKKLRRLAAYIRTLPKADGGKADARPLCDDVPVLERAWAARAGLGFVGKNGMLIVPGQGSFVLLGEVVTTLPLPADDPLEGRCGSCTLCLDACPTGAFPRPFVLDARRCVAYLTIELRGPIPEPQRVGVGEHLFGCDECQTVCPFNASPRKGEAVGQRPFEPAAALPTTSMADLLDEEACSRILSPGSPLLRTGAEGLARNAALVLGNRREIEALPVLLQAAKDHPSPVVREAAGWAVLQMKA
jgi:epoxyqueuosine reductase